ncbi:MAG: HD-GYP domain-containing protein [Lachnospiraceae bacterium]|nr:HD-GYP domain-containing protein [Lachnospiraceae bacterium]
MAAQNGDNRPVERILISRAMPGMELARDIYSRNNQVILNAGSVLDAQKISKIMFYAVDTITVYKQATSESGMTLTQQLKNSVEFREFTQNYDNTVSALKDQMNKVITENAELDEDFLVGEVDRMIMATGGKSRIFNMLHCIRDYDELTYMHSVNVSLICNCFAKWLGMNEDEQRVLTLAGLLHDVGKTAIPREILHKPDSLTPEEYAIVKTHTIKGYDSIKEKHIDDRIKMAVLQHHERADGSGYPYGKTADQIDNFAMITAIADVYDAMTSDRIYRPRICPFEVVRSFENDGYSKFDPQFLVPLLEQISEVYMNHTVRLSDDKVGKIVLMNKQELSKPIVQVDDTFVDLSRQRGVKISEIL